MTDEMRASLERFLAGFEQVSEGYGFDINTEEGLEQFSWGAEVRELRRLLGRPEAPGDTEFEVEVKVAMVMRTSVKVRAASEEAAISKALAFSEHDLMDQRDWYFDCGPGIELRRDQVELAFHEVLQARVPEEF